MEQMKNLFCLILLFAYASAAFSQSPKAPCTPKFIRKEIRTYKKAGDVKKTPVITRYFYNDRYVYYYKMPCCDQQNKLYDKKGNVICIPDGGITGKGDGKCPDFQAEKKNPKQLWPEVKDGN
jgi:hypothetical protein